MPAPKPRRRELLLEQLEDRVVPATVTSVASGNFDNPVIWSTDAVPGPGDTVKIKTYTVSLTGSATAGTLDIGAGGTSGTLSMSSTSSLSVATLNVNQGAFTANGAITVTSAFTDDSNSGGVDTGTFYGGTGTVTLNGADVTGNTVPIFNNLTIAGSVEPNVSAGVYGNTIDVDGNWTNNSSFNANGGLVSFVGGRARRWAARRPRPSTRSISTSPRRQR